MSNKVLIRFVCILLLFMTILGCGKNNHEKKKEEGELNEDSELKKHLSNSKLLTDLDITSVDSDEFKVWQKNVALTKDDADKKIDEYIIKNELKLKLYNKHFFKGINGSDFIYFFKNRFNKDPHIDGEYMVLGVNANSSELVKYSDVVVYRKK